MALYNLFIFFTIKDKIYLFYVIYVFGIQLTYATFKGYSFEFLWKETPLVNFYIPVISSTVVLYMLLFARYFLETQKYSRRLDKGFYGLLGLSGISIFLGLGGQYQLSAITGQLAVILMAVFLIAVTLSVLVSGYKPARFFFIAWIAYLIGLIVFIVQINGGLPLNWFTENSVLFGSALEVVLLSFALADRINVYKKSAEIAQKAALQTSQEKEQLIKEQNVVLVQKISEATEELRMNNEELQSLNEEINSTNEELNATLEALSENKRSLEITNAKMNDSVRYAQTIQTAILPYAERLSKYFHDYFIIYQPKDIVSGDFYWLSELNGKVYFAVADCTGHGVPGAFMSMIGAAALDALVDRDEISDPAQILEGLDAIIRRSLKQAESQNEDGMDIALCVIEQQGNEWHIAFAGAHRPLRYIRASDEKLIEIKGTKRNIGGYKIRDKRPFEVHRIILAKGDCLYLNSDGMADQNNAQNENFGTLRVKALLEKVGVLDAKEQKETILAEFAKHQGREEQRDDITMIGVRI